VSLQKFQEFEFRDQLISEIEGTTKERILEDVEANKEIAPK
jgi:hypothetical protein